MAGYFSSILVVAQVRVGSGVGVTAVDGKPEIRSRLLHLNAADSFGRHRCHSRPSELLRRQRNRHCATTLLHSAVAVAVAAVVLLSTGCVNVAAANVSPSERAALMDMWNGIAGLATSTPSWSSGDPCANHWTGITCSTTPVAVTYVCGRILQSLRRSTSSGARLMLPSFPLTHSPAT